MINLISNSVKYTEEGEICIDVSMKNNNLIIKIIDTGIGISDSDIGNIFLPLFRCSTGIDINSGQGLGLASVKSVCRIIGASVSVESDGINMGSTFTLKVPCMKSTYITTRKIHVNTLILDDSSMILLMLEKYLKKYGLVFKYLNIKDAISHKSDEKIDLIFTDYNLDNENGVDFIHMVRNGGAKCITKDTPIVLCSGGKEFSNREKIPNLFFMDKPFSNIDIESIVSEIFQNRPIEI